MALAKNYCEDSQDEGDLLSPPKSRPQIVSAHDRSTSSTESQLRNAHRDLFTDTQQHGGKSPEKKRSKRRAVELGSADSPRKKLKSNNAPQQPAVDAHDYTSSAVQDAIHDFIQPSDPATGDTVRIATEEQYDTVRDALSVELPALPSAPPDRLEPSSLSIMWSPSVAKTPSTGPSTRVVKSSDASFSDDPVLMPTYNPRPSRSRSAQVEIGPVDWSVRPESTKKTRKKTKDAKPAARSEECQDAQDREVTKETENVSPVVDDGPFADEVRETAFRESPRKSALEVCIPLPVEISPVRPMVVVPTKEKKKKNVRKSKIKLVESAVGVIEGPSPLAGTLAAVDESPGSVDLADEMPRPKASAGTLSAKQAAPLEVLPADDDTPTVQTASPERLLAGVVFSKPCRPPAKEQKISPDKGKSIYRVGLSKRQRIPTLLKMVRK